MLLQAGISWTVSLTALSAPPQVWLEEGSPEYVGLARARMESDLPFVLERGGAALQVRGDVAAPVHRACDQGRKIRSSSLMRHA